MSVRCQPPFSIQINSETNEPKIQNWRCATIARIVVDIECSVNAPCPGMHFSNFNVTSAGGAAPRFICQNVLSESGLSGECRLSINHHDSLVASGFHSMVLICFVRCSAPLSTCRTTRHDLVLHLLFLPPFLRLLWVRSSKNTHDPIPNLHTSISALLLCTPPPKIAVLL